MGARKNRQGGAEWARTARRGYFIWTLIDNFEWTSGFGHPMGFVRVDHATQGRTIKESGYWTGS